MATASFRRTCCVAALALSCDTLLYANPTDVIDAGFKEYSAHGSDAAWEVWTAGSPLSTNKLRKGDYDKGANAADWVYGKMIGYEVIYKRAVSNSVIQVLCTWRFQRGPLYLKFTLYNNSEKWIVSWIECSDRIDSFLGPFELVEPKAKGALER